jgi:hypothetical protein
MSKVNNVVSFDWDVYGFEFINRNKERMIEICKTLKENGNTALYEGEHLTTGVTGVVLLANGEICGWCDSAYFSLNPIVVRKKDNKVVIKGACVGGTVSHPTTYPSEDVIKKYNESLLITSVSIVGYMSVLDV